MNEVPDALFALGFREITKMELRFVKQSEMIEYYDGKDWRYFVKL